MSHSERNKQWGGNSSIHDYLPRRIDENKDRATTDYGPVYILFTCPTNESTNESNNESSNELGHELGHELSNESGNESER